MQACPIVIFYMCIKNATVWSDMPRVVNVPLRTVTKAVQLDFFTQNKLGGWGGDFKFTHLKLHNTFQDVATFWGEVKRLKEDVVKALFKQYETAVLLCTKRGVMASTLPGNRRYVSTRWLLPFSDHGHDNGIKTMHVSHTHAYTLQITGPNMNSHIFT